MQYKAYIHADKIVSLVMDSPGQRIAIQNPSNPVVGSVEITAEQYAEYFDKSQTNWVTYEDGEFSFQLKPPIS